MRLFYNASRLAIAAYLIAALALYLMQDRMLLPSTPDAPDLRSTPHAGDDIAEWKIGGEYAGYVVTPHDGRIRGTFVVYHGNEESAETKLPLADVFVRAGYRAVIVEYPGHGNRSGARTMKAAVSASRQALAATFAQWQQPVYLVGESLGAGMAAQAVKGNEARIAGVVLITPWDSLGDVAAEKYPVFPVRWMLHDTLDSIAAISRYSGPLVIVGAQKDTLIPVIHARHFALEHGNAQFMLLPDADHDSWFGAMTSQKWQEILAWLDAN